MGDELLISAHLILHFVSFSFHLGVENEILERLRGFFQSRHNIFNFYFPTFVQGFGPALALEGRKPPNCTI